jgi:hypothetical protein
MDSFFKFNIKLNLLLANTLLVFFLVALSNIGLLPFQNLGDFLFFAFLIFAFSLYRPGWAFLFFIGTIALENVSLIPTSAGFMLRPYQLLGFFIVGAILIRFWAKRLNFEPIRFGWYDAAISIFIFAGFLSSVFALNKGASFKQSAIILSFGILYWLVRSFIQTQGDLQRIVPFFISSSVVVIFYGIWQNILFSRNLNSFEVMPGRSNATFTEADWLGVFMSLFIAAIYSLMFYFGKKKEDLNADNQVLNSKFKIIYTEGTSYIVLILSYILLILTVSRSAWLAAAAITFIFLFIVLTNLKFNPKDWQWKFFSSQFFLLFSGAALSLGIVYAFNLTSFQLLNRAESTRTGLQKITVSCQENINLPEKVVYSEELASFGCRHINLEEIEAEKERGNYIKEIYRNDPNINIRREIYQKSWEEIKKHPLMGIGWGSIVFVLGNDERGTGLNSSNIFLELWLGSGIIGLAAFLAVWFFIFFRAVYVFWTEPDMFRKTFAFFVIISWTGLTVFNLFNAGIMLAFLWVYLGVSLSLLKAVNLKQ